MSASDRRSDSSRTSRHVMSDEVPHISSHETHQRSQKISLATPKRLLQHYRPQADTCTAANAPHSITSSARPRRVSGKLTPSVLEVDGKRHADRFEEFKRPSRLNENPGNIDQGIWEMVS